MASSKTGTTSKTQETPASGFRSANVIHSNMSSKMNDYCISLASFKLKEFDKGEYSHYKDIAKELKEDFDKKYGGSWHVIVGKSFGSFVTAERNKYVVMCLHRTLSIQILYRKGICHHANTPPTPHTHVCRFLTHAFASPSSQLLLRRAIFFSLGPVLFLFFGHG